MTESASLRICALGDLESIHTRRWLEPFAARGHDVQAISFYAPSVTPVGVTVRSLTAGGSSSAQNKGGGASRSLAGRLPPTLLRLLNALRYERKGLGKTVRRLQPQILHAHYVVEHGFFAATTGFHPLVVTAWGSDILVATARSRLTRAIARYTLRRADLVTSNNEYMSERIRALGVPSRKVATVVFGTDEFYLEDAEQSVNLAADAVESPPTVVSTRSLDSPLYNVDSLLRAMAIVRGRLREARLIIAGEGRLRPALESLAAELGSADGVEFTGFLDQQALRDVFHRAHVYASIPSSDATSVSTLSAMAAGCFPVVSDLPTQREWIDDGVNGFRVPVDDVAALAYRLEEALTNGDLRRQAATANRRLVEERGVWERNVPEMERLYRQLAK